MSKKILITMTDELLVAVDAQLHRRHKNRSELVRDLFRRWLEEEQRREDMKADAEHAKLDAVEETIPYMGQ